MKTEETNWWDDPKNAEEVKRISWWNHPENRTTVEIPVAIVKTDNDHYVITPVDDEDNWLGKELHCCASGDTKEEAIKDMFQMIRWLSEFHHERSLDYQRWVPLRIGPWGSIGGRWFSIFGMHFSFRYGRSNKGGRIRYRMIYSIL
jgi:hypothetical protein